MLDDETGCRGETCHVTDSTCLRQAVHSKDTRPMHLHRVDLLLTNTNGSQRPRYTTRDSVRILYDVIEPPQPSHRFAQDCYTDYYISVGLEGNTSWTRLTTAY